MSDCIHCDIHDLLESRLQDREVNLAEVAAKVTEVVCTENLIRVDEVAESPKLAE